MEKSFFSVENTNVWYPEATQDLADGEALHCAFYKDGQIDKPLAWRYNPTSKVVDLVVEEIKRLLEKKTGSIKILDYGSGTGFLIIEMLKRLEEMELLSQINHLEIDFEVFLLDIPCSWFAKGYHLLKKYNFAKFYSILDSQTKQFLPLVDVIDEQKVNIIVSSGVLHLIKTRALSKLFDSFSNVLEDGGKLFWDSPDVGIASKNSILFHNPYREMRTIALDIIEKNKPIKDILSLLSEDERHNYEKFEEQLNEEISSLNEERRTKALMFAEKTSSTHTTRCRVVRNLLGKISVKRLYFF